MHSRTHHAAMAALAVVQYMSITYSRTRGLAASARFLSISRFSGFAIVRTSHVASDSHTLSFRDDAFHSSNIEAVLKLLLKVTVY